MNSSRVEPTVPKAFPIVVGIDFDPVCEHALREAFRLGAMLPGAEIHAVHAIVEAPRSPHSAAALDRVAQLLDEVPPRLRAHLADLAERHPEARGQVITVHCRLGAPEAVIAQLAVDLDAELILVGTHGRTGLRRAALGSVATRLVTHAPCPVLVAWPRDATGWERSDAVEPPCPDCAQARATSGDAGAWCEEHLSRAQGFRPRATGYSEVFTVGRREASIVSLGP